MNLPPESFEALVALIQKTRAIANDLTGGLVQDCLDLVADELLEFGSQGDVHAGFGRFAAVGLSLVGIHRFPCPTGLREKRPGLPQSKSVINFGLRSSPQANTSSAWGS